MFSHPNLRYAARHPVRTVRKVISKLTAGASKKGGVDWNDVSEEARLLESRDPIASMHLHSALVRIAPDNALFQFRQALSLRAAGQDGEATHYFERAARLAPDEPVYRTTLTEHAIRNLGVQPGLALLDSLPRPAPDVASAVQMALFVSLVKAQAFDLAMRRAPEALGPCVKRLGQAEEHPGKYSIIVTLSDRAFDIQFTRDFLYWTFLIERLIALVPYLTRLCQEGQQNTRVQISLGDFADGEGRQICFSGDRPHHHLAPDPIFLNSSAYAGYRRTIANNKTWAQRRDKAYWRGSLTGQADTITSIMQLPRVSLCLFARTDARFDAKLTDLSQFGPWLPDLQHITQGLGIVGDRQPETENTKYRYLIDIDGNTNSWPGFWMKLAAGGTVIKLRSAYRQWYYDRLVDRGNVYFCDDIDRGLPAALDALMEQPALAEGIANAGSALAMAMTLDSEYPAFRQAVSDAAL